MYWILKIVYDSGYSEEEICIKLENKINGGSWMIFETDKKLWRTQNIKKSKKEGKY